MLALALTPCTGFAGGAAQGAQEHLGQSAGKQGSPGLTWLRDQAAVERSKTGLVTGARTSSCYLSEMVHLPVWFALWMSVVFVCLFYLCPVVLGLRLWELLCLDLLRCPAGAGTEDS